MGILKNVTSILALKISGIEKENLFRSLSLSLSLRSAVRSLYTFMQILRVIALGSNNNNCVKKKTWQENQERKIKFSGYKVTIDAEQTSEYKCRLSDLTDLLLTVLHVRKESGKSNYTDYQHDKRDVCVCVCVFVSSFYICAHFRL